MALPASGPLSLNDIQVEFGGANPIGINEYYGVAAGIPASGTIAIDDFYGASAATPFFAGSLLSSTTSYVTSRTVTLSGVSLSGGSQSTIEPFNSLCAVVSVSGFSSQLNQIFGTPSGWVKQADLYVDETWDANVAVFTKKLGATVDTNVTFSWSGSSGRVAIVIFAIGGTGDTAPSLRRSSVLSNTSSPTSSTYATTGTDSYVCFAGGSQWGAYSGDTPYTIPSTYYTNFATTDDGSTTVASGIAGFVNAAPSSIASRSFGGGSGGPYGCGACAAVVEFF